MNTIIKISKTAKKYVEIIHTGFIAESQIISLRSWLSKNKEERSLIFDAISASGGLNLNPDQNEKGYNFLMNEWKSPSGRERKNNPFGYREQAVLNTFSHFELVDLYNAGNAYIDYYLPVYECISKDGASFQYYYNGKVNIIG